MSKYVGSVYRPTVREFLFNGQSLCSPVHIFDEGESRTRFDLIFEGSIEDTLKSEYADYYIDCWEARYNGVKVVIEITLFAERNRRRIAEKA